MDIEATKSERRRVMHQARRNAVADVLEGMAQNSAVAVLLDPDPKRAAEAFGQSMWALTQASMLRCGVMEIEAVRITLGGEDE